MKTERNIGEAKLFGRTERLYRENLFKEDVANIRKITFSNIPIGKAMLILQYVAGDVGSLRDSIVQRKASYNRNISYCCSCGKKLDGHFLDHIVSECGFWEVV